MYLSHFGLSQKPFSSLPDPAFLYKSPEHAEALKKLEHAMLHDAGITLLCSDTGCGKTTLIRYLINNLNESTHLGLVSLMRPSSDHLLPWVLYAFGLDYQVDTEVGQYDALLNALVDNYQSGKRSVLIVDEAHELSASALEEVRMLSNLNVDEQPLISIVLSGHLRLVDRLQTSELAMLSQRIRDTLILSSLPREECGRYIDHRMRVAGGVGAVFTPESVEQIYQASSGVPRLVNSICETALIHSCSRGENSISGDDIRAIVDGRRLPVAKSSDHDEHRDFDRVETTPPKPGFVGSTQVSTTPPVVHSVIKRSVTPFGVNATVHHTESSTAGGSANDAHHTQIHPRKAHGPDSEDGSEAERELETSGHSRQHIIVAADEAGTVKPIFPTVPEAKSLRVQIKLLLQATPKEDSDNGGQAVIAVVTQLREKGFEILNHRTHYDRQRDQLALKVLTNWYGDAARIATEIGSVSGVKTVLDVRFPPTDQTAGGDSSSSGGGARQTDPAQERAARAKRRARAASFFGPEPF